jgi:RHS repeat-associated protein
MGCLRLDILEQDYKRSEHKMFTIKNSLTKNKTNINVCSTYLYGFNGKENDDEVKGKGNNIDFGSRIDDPRLGRFLSLDPRAKDFHGLSPYAFSANNPIKFIDIDGEGVGDPPSALFGTIAFSLGGSKNTSLYSKFTFGIGGQVGFKSNSAVFNITNANTVKKISFAASLNVNGKINVGAAINTKGQVNVFAGTAVQFEIPEATTTFKPLKTFTIGNQVIPYLIPPVGPRKTDADFVEEKFKESQESCSEPATICGEESKLINYNVNENKVEKIFALTPEKVGDIIDTSVGATTEAVKDVVKEVKEVVKDIKELKEAIDSAKKIIKKPI